MFDFLIWIIISLSFPGLVLYQLHSFLLEPVKLRLRLAILSVCKMLRLNHS